MILMFCFLAMKFVDSVKKNDTGLKLKETKINHPDGNFGSLISSKKCSFRISFYWHVDFHYTTLSHLNCADKDLATILLTYSFQAKISLIPQHW